MKMQNGSITTKPRNLFTSGTVFRFSRISSLLSGFILSPVSCLPVLLFPIISFPADTGLAVPACNP